MAACLSSSAHAQAALYGVAGPDRSLYRINTETGGATLIGSTGITDNPPVALASDSARGIVWAKFNGLDFLYQVDLTSGEATAVVELDFQGLTNVGLAYDPARDLLFISDQTSDILYSFSPSIGEVNLIGSTENNISGMAFDLENNVLYGTTGASDALFTLDTTTGEGTLVGLLGIDSNATGLAFDPETGTLYLTELNTDSLYTVDTTTGAATLVGALGVENIVGLTFLSGIEMPPSEIKIVSIDHDATVASIGFEGRVGESYILRKSPDLDFSDAPIIATITLSGNVGAMEDPNASEERAFYRVEEAAAPPPATPRPN